MVLFREPLLQEDDYEHRGQHEVQPFGVKVDEGAEQPAQCGAGEPVQVVQKRHEEHEPAFVNILGNICRIVDGKAFIAHPEDEVKGFPAISAVFFQHGDPVEQMPGVDHKSHRKCLQRSNAPSRRFTVTNSMLPAKIVMLISIG